VLVHLFVGQCKCVSVRACILVCGREKESKFVCF